jgi:hypothetical protein
MVVHDTSGLAGRSTAPARQKERSEQRRREAEDAKGNPAGAACGRVTGRHR